MDRTIRISRTGSNVLVLLLAAFAGCSMFGSKKEQLERVAKDWCLVIRASQVIPVYPLTEDLQPGDMFLVQLPIEEQQRAYEGKGFLPLDNHIARITPIGYREFYKESFLLGSASPTLPNEAFASQPPWANVARAAFPSYSFSVRQGGGLNLALPVSGVPVGLSLLGASAADGSITLLDARTYGVDTLSLAGQVRRAADDPATGLGQFLSSFYAHSSVDSKQAESQPESYLRVVSRVYLVGEVNVSLRDARSSGVSLAVGASPPPLELMTASNDGDPEKASVANYEGNLTKLNTAVEEATKLAGAEGAKPGGALKIVSATSRSVGLQEKFPRPLVVGYLGFDMEILPGGRLGNAIPVYARLAGENPAGFFPPTLRPIWELSKQIEESPDAESRYPVVLKALGGQLLRQYETASASMDADARKALFRGILTDYLEPEIAETDGPLHQNLIRALELGVK